MKERIDTYNLVFEFFDSDHRLFSLYPFAFFMRFFFSCRSICIHSKHEWKLEFFSGIYMKMVDAKFRSYLSF